MAFMESNGGVTTKPKASGGRPPKERAVHERALRQMREKIMSDPEAAVRYLRQLGMFSANETAKKNEPLRGK